MSGGQAPGPWQEPHRAGRCLLLRSRSLYRSPGTRFPSRERPCRVSVLVFPGEQAQLHGVFHELGAAVQVELDHNVGAVGLDGVDAKRKDVSELLVGVALANELKHILLTLAQVVICLLYTSDADDE